MHTQAHLHTWVQVLVKNSGRGRNARCAPHPFGKGKKKPTQNESELSLKTWGGRTTSKVRLSWRHPANHVEWILATTATKVTRGVFGGEGGLDFFVGGDLFSRGGGVLWLPKKKRERVISLAYQRKFRWLSWPTAHLGSRQRRSPISPRTGHWRRSCGRWRLSPGPPESRSRWGSRCTACSWLRRFAQNRGWVGPKQGGRGGGGEGNVKKREREFTSEEGEEGAETLSRFLVVTSPNSFLRACFLSFSKVCLVRCWWPSK